MSKKHLLILILIAGAGYYFAKRPCGCGQDKK